MGWLLRVNSTFIINALDDPSYTGRSLSTNFNDLLVSLIIESQEPPIHGLLEGLKLHGTLLIKKLSNLV